MGGLVNITIQVATAGFGPSASSAGRGVVSSAGRSAITASERAIVGGTGRGALISFERNSVGAAGRAVDTHVERGLLGGHRPGQTSGGSGYKASPYRNSFESSKFTSNSGGIAGLCFIGGTEIATEDGLRPIELLKVGERVLTTDSSSSTEVEPSNWRKIVLRMPNPECPEDILDLELLRSIEWMQKTGAKQGASIWFELEEMGLQGWAAVERIEPCPPIQPGQGRVILATVTHLNTYVMEVSFHGGAKSLKPTDRHRLFSVTRNAWVPTVSIQPSEKLSSKMGEIEVAAVRPVPGTHRVFNLEVETDHCYYAGAEKILSHNTNPCAAPAAKTAGQLGREGEAAMQAATGLPKNTQAVFVNGRARIPDFATATNTTTRLPSQVIEVKNVRYQSLIRQLRDYADLVGPGGRVDVALPPGARVSRPLQNAFDNPNSPLFRMDLPR